MNDAILDAPSDHLFGSDEEMELNFGPQHPSTHGVLRLKLRVDGERILSCYPIIGYLHRGTEKLFELHPFFQNVPHTDRMDYVAAATSNVAADLLRPFAAARSEFLLDCLDSQDTPGRP